MLVLVVVVATGILFLIRVFVAFSMELWDGRTPTVAKNGFERRKRVEPFLPAPQSSRRLGIESRLRSAAMAVNEADERAEVRHFDPWARRSGF
jgi:hypothetical protein